MIGGSILYLLLAGLDMATAAEQLLNGLYTGFILLAIPLFILAGNIAARGGVARVIIDLATALVGRFRGGLPMGVVAGTMLQSGVSGSTVADVSAMAAMTGFGGGAPGGGPAPDNGGSL